MAKQNKKFVATTLTAAMVASAVAPVAGAAFTDSIPNYAKDAVGYVTEKGIMNGLGGTTEFGATKNITRAEVAVLLSNALGLDTKGKTASFSDVPATHWASSAIAAVVEAGIAKGTDKGFEPAKNITRQEAAVMFANAYELELNELAEVSFKDQAKIASWAKDQVEILASLGIFGGKEGGLFAPTDLITRGEVAALVHRTEVADVRLKVTEKESVLVDSIKAINATTVEVTFKEALADVNATKYTIEGLTVSNAAVKQTDAKTVVLTTSVQTGDKEYTVKAGETTLGKFKGVSAVVPSKVNVTTASLQGVIGNEVTLKAEVTVAEGQSKAGIPVTFNIVNGNSNNKTIEVEATTDENGVATYSYTRYYSGNDNVVAYATTKSTIYANATVYWANQKRLAVEEITTSNDLANKANKVYKVTALDKANGYVLVGFKENIGVTPDKAVTDVTFQNALVYNVSTNGNIVLAGNNGTADSYPHQLTTGSTRVALVKIDANGVGSFSLTGSNASVTPVVYEDSYTYNGNAIDGILNAGFEGQERQVVVPTVKFSSLQSLELKVVAEGTQNAAAYALGVNPAVDKENVGGRNYKVTLTGKDGKFASEGSTAYVVFGEADFKGNVYVNGTKVVKDVLIPIVVEGDKGEVTFRVTGEKDGFATPTVLVNNGTDINKLDKSDLQQVAETTYFTDATINAAKLTVTDKLTGKVIKDLEAGNIAVFTYTSVDQNGFHYYKAGAPRYDVTFHLTSQFANVTVTNQQDQTLAGANNSYTVPANNKGVASIEVKSNVAQTVSATVTAANGILPLYSASVEFKAMSSVLDRVNVATTSNQVLTALRGNATYKAKLDTLSVTYQNLVAQNILDKRPGAGYSQAQLNTVFTAETNAVAGLLVTGTSVYTAEVAAKLKIEATGNVTVLETTNKSITATVDSAITTQEGYNDSQVNFVNGTDAQATPVIVTYANGVYTVALKTVTTAATPSVPESKVLDNSVTYTAVKTAVEAFEINSAKQLKLNLGTVTGTVVANDLVGKTITLGGGQNAAGLQKSKVTLSFSEALVTTNSTVSLEITHIDGTTATITSDALGGATASREVVLTFTADPALLATDKITAITGTGITLPTGKTFSDSIVITTP